MPKKTLHPVETSAWIEFFNTVRRKRILDMMFCFLMNEVEVLCHFFYLFNFYIFRVFWRNTNIIQEWYWCAGSTSSAFESSWVASFWSLVCMFNCGVSLRKKKKFLIGGYRENKYEIVLNMNVLFPVTFHPPVWFVFGEKSDQNFQGHCPNQLLHILWSHFLCCL